MLQPCSNPDCSVQFATTLDACPACGTVVSRRGERREESGADPRKIEAGRTILFGYLALILGISVGVTTLYTMAQGITERLPFQMIRFLLTVLLCFYTYRGSVIARWLLVLLLTIGGLLSLTLVASGQPAAFLIGAGMALVYLSFVVVIVTSRSVAAFLVSQRDKYNTV